MNTQIGYIIKERRKSKKMTLAQLASKTGLSVSYLSLLERGLNNPTVESLNKICFALDLMLSDLISKMESGPAVVIRANERNIIYKNDGYMYESATDGSHSLSCMVMTVNDNDIHLSSPHVTDEIGYVVKGSLMIRVNDTKHELFEGDCIYIEANNEHGYQKTSEETCICLWFSYTSSHAEITPPKTNY